MAGSERVPQPAVTVEQPPRYVLHPGWVVSQTDGQRHFIGAGRLRVLHRVPPTAQVVVIDTWVAQMTYRKRPDDVHCRLRRDGQYPVRQPR